MASLGIGVLPRTEAQIGGLISGASWLTSVSRHVLGPGVPTQAGIRAWELLLWKWFIRDPLGRD